ncbi:MAG: trypsin-like serine protease [Microbacteriaceae bacterium]
MKNRGMVRRPLALTAATTIALGGLFFSTPAYATTADEPDHTESASTTAEETTVEDGGSAEEAAAEDGAEEATEEDGAEEATEEDDTASEEAPSADVRAAANAANVVAWGYNASGDPVVVAVADEVDEVDDAQLDAFLATDAFEEDAADPIVATVAAAPESFAEGDVVGGQGYLGIVPPDGLGACSFGFAAWSPSGDPAMLTAGHCAMSWEDSFLSIPGQDPAVVGGEGGFYEEPIEHVGSFGFSQFGGPGNSAGYDENVPLEDQQFTDIAVIDLADGFTPLPEVTTWESATDDLSSLADDTVNITSVGNPTAGPVTKSGRTTGMTHGEIIVTDAEDTHILDGWSNIGDHIVRGFSSNVEATQGDSGGSVIQGSTAVGVISGGVTAEDNGGEQWTWSTLLTDALPYTDGYEVALHIDAPVVTAPESGSTVEVGSTVTGTAPGAESVEITMGGSTSTVSVTDGAFSFAAPGEAGDYTYSLVGVNGYDSSAATAYELSVEEAPTPAPVISSPADGAAVVDVVTEVSGTGVPNAEVVVTIDDTEYTTTVDGAGNWTVADLELSYGSHTISAVQTANDDTSDAATVTFEIVLTAPEVTSITDGTAFAHDDAPSNLEGTGIDGATVTVELSGAEPAAGEMRSFAATNGSYTATVADGVWVADFGGQIQPGAYTVRVTQEVDGTSSAVTSLAFEVVPADAGDGGDNGDDAGNGGENGTGGESGSGDDGNLAATGTDMIVPLTAAAGAVALLAGGITLMIRRRQNAEV